MTGQAAWTGPITEAGAMNISAVFCAVSLKSESVASMPLFLYERTENGKTRAEGHPAYKIVHRRPNRNTSPSRFKRLVESWRALWGNGYAEIERLRNGTPVALWPIHPNRVKPDVRTNGDIYWKVRNDDGTETTIPDMDMFHIMGPSNDGIVGMSLIGKARDSLGLTTAAEAYGRRFFANSAVPSGIIEHPGPLKPLARENLRTSWERMHSGDNQGKVAVLEEGMKFTNIGMPSKDAQFLETRQFQVVEVARWFNMPVHKLKEMGRATWANIEHSEMEYVQDSVMPLAIDFEEECDRKLLTDGGEGGLFFEFLVDGLLRSDLASRYAAYAVGRQWGWLSVNDIRARENMNELDGDEGDIYLVPMNMTPADQVNSPENAPQPPAPKPESPPDSNGPIDPETEPDANNPVVPRVAEAFTDVFAGVYSRLLVKESKAAERAAKKPETFAAWADEFYADHVLLVRQALIPACESLAAALAAVSGNVAIPSAVAEATKTLAMSHSDRSIAAVKAGVGVVSTPEWSDRGDEEAKESIALIMELVTT